MKKIIILFITLFAAFLFAESEGEKLFKTNNPSGSAVLLEQEIASGEITSNTFNLLGLAYFQLGDYNKSIDAFERGMKNPLSNRRQLAFNEGNVAYTQGDYAKAENCFSLAVSARPDFSEAILNRANARLMAKKYKDAADDYRRFLEIRPSDVQSDNIRRVLAYLGEEIRAQEESAARFAEEQKRLEEENRRMQEELARQKAEYEAAEAARKAAEEERRRKLLEEVANSLQQTDSTNMSAGAEDVIDYDYESELE